MKEPVFQFYVTLTKEDYIRYNRTIVWRYKRSKWMLIISIVLLVLTCIILLLGNLDLSSLSVYDYLPLLLFFLLGWYLITGIDRHAAKFFKINKMGGETKLLFFDDCLEYFGPTGAGNGTWQFKDLDSIIVTKTDVYFMYSPVYGLCVKKSECPEGFLEFVGKIRVKENK